MSRWKQGNPKGLSLSIRAGEVHAIMGQPVRASPLCLMAWRAAPVMTSPRAASAICEDLVALAPEERAAKGVFLDAVPVEIPGVTTMTFLKTALIPSAGAGRK